MEMLPLCLMFLTFFLSLGGSLRALMMRAAAEGTTLTLACRFWMVSWTVIFKPFQSWVALAMSSPIFLGDKPRGPTLGARVAVAATSPPTALKQTTLISLGSNFGGMVVVQVGLVSSDGGRIPTTKSALVVDEIYQFTRPQKVAPDAQTSFLFEENFKK